MKRRIFLPTSSPALPWRPPRLGGSTFFRLPAGRDEGGGEDGGLAFVLSGEARRAKTDVQLPNGPSFSHLKTPIRRI
jgi:hypothetical protein